MRYSFMADALHFELLNWLFKEAYLLCNFFPPLAPTLEHRADIAVS
jgi:hypothetical protein